MNTTIRIFVVPGTPKYGEWCDTCLLPAVTVIPVYMMGSYTVTRLTPDVRVCDNCTPEPPHET